MKKRPEVTEQTRQMLVDTFCQLLCTKPVNKISIQEITTAAGYNRCTFYQYFKDIYELEEYIENDVLDYLKAHIISSASSPRESGTRELFQLLKNKGAYLKPLLGDYGSIHFLERLKAEILPIFSYDTQARYMPYLNEYRVSTMLSIFRIWVKQEYDLSYEELSNLLFHLYANALDLQE